MQRASYSLLSVLALTLVQCTPSKPAGFGIDGSSMKYVTTKFDDPNQLAEVEGMKISTAQILDKSPVIKDLDQQRHEALAAMIYLKATQAHAKEKGTVEVYLPSSPKPLEQLLARFDRKPTPHVTLTYAKTADKDVLGKFGSDVIHREDIDMNNAVLQSIEQRRYTEVVSQLDHQMSRVLLNERAMKAQQPLQEYIDKVVLGGTHSTISEAELKAHLDKIGFADSEMTPELKEQFTGSLAQQKEQRAVEDYVAHKVLSGPIKVSFTPPTTSIQLSDQWQPVAGDQDAPIAMVAFAGTTCPDCPDFVNAIQKTMDHNKGYLKLNWIHTFNTNDGVARMMAEAALCMDSVKSGRGMSFVTDFSQKSANIDEHAFYTWASDHKVDEKSFKECFVGQKQNERLDQHLAYARQVGIVANPSLWIDGQMMEGVIKPEMIQRTIDERIAQRQSSPIGAAFRRVRAWFRAT